MEFKKRGGVIHSAQSQRDPSRLKAGLIIGGWTELIPLRNKAIVWTANAFREVIKIKRIHVDNGSKFINSHLFRFCRESGIEFVRSRSYRKNDAPYVKSKNWSLVRQYMVWRRYDTEGEYRILRKLMKLVSIRHNLIIPQMKVVEKYKINGKKTKRYEIDTPLNRMLRVEGVSEEVERKFNSLRDNVKILKLTQAIIKLKSKHNKAYNKKRSFKCASELHKRPFM